MNGRPQFTPRQILDAGLRAESVNQLDHAAQFFRFLLEHHSSAPEADAAREHLNRVSTPRLGDTSSSVRPELRSADMRVSAVSAGEAGPAPPKALERMRPLPQQSPPSYTNGHAGGPVIGASAVPQEWADAGPSPFAARQQPQPPPAANGAMYPGSYGAGVRPAAAGEGRGEPGPGAGQRYDARSDATQWPAAWSGPASGAPSMVPAPASDVRLTWPHLHLPPPVSNYLIGRFMAGAMMGFGIVAIVAGIAMIGLTISRGGGLPGLMAEALAPGAAIVSGLLLILAGQAARALFDGANASRELVAIVRSMADPHSGNPPPQ